ncbi:[protein-PII] uridylyltransferase [Thalassotalea atypica]|uniref:[protein-PII] uridylyltransferase n=1 Tax=Thalassotalea atypica TaxID=2054316 RepID=UPI0025733C7D|nr:[protein-PII] uridylyltransferase [Thalassotalea atypica]
MENITTIPPQYHEALCLTAPHLDSLAICALSTEFNQWHQSIFVEEDMEYLVKAKACFVDLILTKLWVQHQLDEYQISLVAVGGYGRGELHPHSDVDILLLTQTKIEQVLEDKIGAFITQLWDVKLDIGHSVRDVKECLKQAVKDVTVATNLMEMRLISGNEALPEQLYPLLKEDVFWTSKKFFVAKRDEQKKRHQQYHGAAYTLEPNLKANPGGLRDIQTIAWVAKRHFDAGSLEELVEHNYLTRNELNELLECQDYLWRMRFALHYVAGRSENRLLFDYQADVAEMMGFGGEGKVTVERMMKRFFRIIGRVAELNKMLLQHFESEILDHKKSCKIIDIDKNFYVADGLVRVKSQRIFMSAVKIMELFLAIAQNNQIKGLHPDTLRLLRNARRRLISGLIDYAENRRIFIEIIKHPRGLGLPFTLMHRHSILAVYLPQWRAIVGQMQFDLFHAYSVDEHSYRLIKNLYRFSQAEHNHEFPLCSKIMQRIRKPEVLYLAGIFHDIAKGRGGDHAKLGAVDALDFCKVHNINDHDGRMVSWLVEQHLTMSVTAQRRDISDPEVISQFGDIVRDEAHLDYLYCLTVADMRATNENLWNSWKANLLEDLYFATKRAFRRGLEKPVDMRAKIRENQQEAMSLLLTNTTLNESEIETLWHEFKADYFLRYSPTQIDWHTKHIIAHDRSKPLVLISPVPYRGGTEVFVFTKEIANIFANTVSVLAHKKLSIHDAKIITSKTGYTLNTFVVLDQRSKPIDDQYRAKEIVHTLTNELNKTDLDGVNILPISKRFEQFNIPTKVSFVDTDTKRSTLLEIVATDRPCLLASFAQVFHNLKINIHSAKITTFGERAEDVFIVSNAENLALTEQEQTQLTDQLCDNIE